jgi:hypothetical protein
MVFAMEISVQLRGSRSAVAPPGAGCQLLSALAALAERGFPVAPSNRTWLGAMGRLLSRRELSGTPEGSLSTRSARGGRTNAVQPGPGNRLRSTAPCGPRALAPIEWTSCVSKHLAGSRARVHSMIQEGAPPLPSLRDGRITSSGRSTPHARYHGALAPHPETRGSRPRRFTPDRRPKCRRKPCSKRSSS